MNSELLTIGIANITTNILYVAYRYTVDTVANGPQQVRHQFVGDPQQGDLLFVFHFAPHFAYSYVNDIAIVPETVAYYVRNNYVTEQQFREGVDAGMDGIDMGWSSGMTSGNGLRGGYYNCHCVYNDGTHDAQCRAVIKEQLETQLGFRF